MSDSADDPHADSQGSGRASERPGGQVDSQLVEALIHLLIEKGVLTKNDALSVVQTVAQVQRGAVEEGDTSPQTTATLQMLQRMYRSFEVIADRPGVVLSDVENVRRLRPPIYGDRLDFPRDD